MGPVVTVNGKSRNPGVLNKSSFTRITKISLYLLRPIKRLQESEMTQVKGKVPEACSEQKDQHCFTNPLCKLRSKSRY